MDGPSTPTAEDTPSLEASAAPKSPVWKSLVGDKRRLLLLTIAVCFVAMIAMVAALSASLSSDGESSASSSENSYPTDAVSAAESDQQVLAPVQVDEGGSASASAANAAVNALADSMSGSSSAASAALVGATAALADAAAAPAGSCRLDPAMDPNLLYLECPFVANANAGFAIDKPCLSGETCVYACEPPYVCTENGFSDLDCVPYLGRCDPYSPATYKSGLRCTAGAVAKPFPDKPLCAMGLNTSYIKSYVAGVVASCQTVYPGNEAPMIGIEVREGQAQQLTSFPQWYWHGTHAHFYVSVPNKTRAAACQWNYDPLSLNSGGVDAMPYVLGGGALLGNPCSECGQHDLDFGENFDFAKAYSSLPGFGVRVRNCNDVSCGDILCDATYTYDAASHQVARYWAVYNTVYGETTVGCVADAVRGNAWSGLARDTDKFTQFEFYPIDAASGQQSASCTNCSRPSGFDPSRCRLLRARKKAVFGTGVSPALYVCTPTGGAVSLEYKLSFVATASGDHGGDDAATTAPNVVAVQVLALFALCAVVTVLGVATFRFARHRQQLGGRTRDTERRRRSCADARKRRAGGRGGGGRR